MERIREKTAFLVGNNYDVTQPIEMRFNELIGGVRSDVAVKIYGEDLDQLAASAQRVASVLRKTPGSSDVRVAQTTGFPTFDISFDRAAIARYGLTVKEVADTVATALAGKPCGPGLRRGPPLRYRRAPAGRAARQSRRAGRAARDVARGLRSAACLGAAAPTGAVPIHPRTERSQPRQRQAAHLCGSQRCRS